MKVYIVTSGEYFDYGIDAVFTDRRNAELYCASRDNNERDYHDNHMIEEYKTSDNIIAGTCEIVYMWRARKLAENLWDVDLFRYCTGECEVPKSSKGTIYFITRKNDKDLATRIFYDMLAKQKEEEETKDGRTYRE